MTSELKIKIEDQTLFLSGHLNDRVNLEPFEKEMENIHKVNFSGLYTVTWIGVQTLLRFLNTLSQNIEIEGVSPALLRLIIIFPEIGNRLIPTKFQVECFKTGHIETHSVNLEDLIQLQESQGLFGKIDNALVIGGLHHLCRPRMGSSQNVELKIQSEKLKPLWESILFFFDYIAFMRIVVESSAIAQRTTMVLIEENLQRILLLTVDLNQAIKVIRPELEISSNRELMTLMPYIREKTTETSDAIDKNAHQLENILLNLEVLIIEPKSNTDSFFNIIQEIIILSENIQNLAISLEQVGSDIGEKVFAFGNIFQLKKEFETFDSSSLTSKTIHTLRRKMKFEPQEEPLWKDFLEEIFIKFKILQEDLNQCVMTMQGFDLVRQILEHRIEECLFLKDLSLQDISTESLLQIKEKILKHAHRRAVTDQEKYALSFYFPNSQEPAEQKLQSGGIMFF